MAWQPHGTAWRQCMAPLRQEAVTAGMVARPSLQLALNSLRVAAAEVPENELVADLSFLVQQLLGPPAFFGSLPRDISAHLALCRLLAGIAAVRTIRLHAPAANLILAALRQWADADQAASLGATPSASTLLPASTNSGPVGAPSPAVPAEAEPPAASLQLEALSAIAALLPSHLGLLSEHERAAQLAALHSLLASSRRGNEVRSSELLECQCLALSTLTACCGPAAATATTITTSSLTMEEAGALISSAASLLQTCACRSRPVEDSAHCRLYTGLVRALQAAVGEAKQAWLARAAMLVEGLQRFLTYGIQPCLSTAVTPAASPVGPGPNGAATTAPTQGLGGSCTSGSGAAAGGSGGGRYRPPHLRRRESQADTGYSDSDLSDTEHTGGLTGPSLPAGSGGAGAVIDRFRSSRVRLAALSCIQAMTKSDPRAMHAHWTALLPLQNPLQPRPLTPHLLTVLLYDPLVKVRALAAATIATLLDGPASRSILTVAESKSMAARAPLRGFLNLSLSMGALLLSTHIGLLHAVGHEASPLVLPGVLRALVVTMAASPYERLPPELLPQTLQVLRARWSVLSAAPASTASGELAPIHAAYMACLAESFGTKQPVPGLAAHLRAVGTQTQQQLEQDRGANSAGAGRSCRTEGEESEAGRESSFAVDELVRELLAVGRDVAAPAVLRIEALAALKGLAANYTFAMPSEAWDDLRATAEVGLTSAPPTPRASPGPRSRGDGPPSRSSSSSSLSLSSPAPARSGERQGPRPQTSSSSLVGPSGPGGSSLAAAPGSAVAGGGGGVGACGSPEDKAAQLAVKLVSDYLAAVARQAGFRRVDPNGGTGEGRDMGAISGAPPSPGYVSLAAAVPRHQLHQGGGPLSPVGSDVVASEEERQGAVQRLAGMWRDTVALLVPAATAHASYMVRAAGLACLGDIPQPVFHHLPAQLQNRMLTLLADAAAGEAVAAVRSAACKALGATAAFPPVLAQGELSDQVSHALGSCLRDSVLSVRIAAAWAVANLCDAHRRRLAAVEDTRTKPCERTGSVLRDGQPPTSRSPTNALAPNRDAAYSLLAYGGPETSAGIEPLYQPHHYQQLAALCSAAILATQDADKVRANGIRAVGNLLALLSPDMAKALEVANGCPSTGSGGGDSGCRGDVEQGRGQGEMGRADSRRGGGGADVAGSWRNSSSSSQVGHGSSRGVGAAGWREGTSGGGSLTAGAGGLQFDEWLDAALTCLQSSLTTGGMKVQWNACYAALGLLRNPQLLAHPRLASRLAPLLLLLVMLVRESANFKIRTHASAALAALPCREAYGDVLPDALLVVASALEGLSNGSTTTATGPSTAVASSAKSGIGGAGGGGDGGGPVSTLDEPADGRGDEGEGRFPNYRYAASLSAQLRATLLHLLSLARPQDARRVREALARRTEFLHACLREQLGEAVQALRAHSADGSCEGEAKLYATSMCDDLPASGPGACRAPLRMVHSGRSSSGTLLPQRARLGGEVRSGSGALALPADPFGLSGSRGSTVSRDAGPGGLAALLSEVNLREEGLTGPSASVIGTAGTADVSSREAGVNGAASSWRLQGIKDSSAFSEAGGGAGNTCRSNLTVVVPAEPVADEVQSARARVAALAAPLRGFAALLTQLGPSCDTILRDVQQALERMTPAAPAAGTDVIPVMPHVAKS